MSIDTENTATATPSEPAEEPSLEEALAAKYRELTAEGSSTDESAQADTPPRDERGRFTRAQQQAAAAAEAAADGTEEAARESDREQLPTDEASQQNTQEDQLAELPKSWRREVAEDWKKAPLSVRAEVMKREEDYLRGIHQYKNLATIGHALDSVIRPYADDIRASGMTAPQVVGNALATLKTLATGTPEAKAATILQLMSTYGISPSALVSGSGSGTGASDGEGVSPELLALRKEVQELRGTITQLTAAREQAEQSEIDRQVDAFLGDPKNEFAKDVLADMQQLLAAGLASSLQEAYDKACKLNPAVAAKLASRQEAERVRRAAETAAAARRASSTNVVRRGTHPAPGANSTLEDELRQVYRKATGR